MNKCDFSLNFAIETRESISRTDAGRELHDNGAVRPKTCLPKDVLLSGVSSTV